MIYLIGASHMGVVTSAWAHPEDNKEHQFGQSPPSFLSFRSINNEDHFGFKAASIYIGHYSQWWGTSLAQIPEKNLLVVAQGFKDLLESIKNDTKNSLFVFMTGEEHYHLGLINNEPQIDFEVPWRKDIPIGKSRQIIPFKIIEKQITSFLNKAFLNFIAIKRFSPQIPIFNVICPPPIIQNSSLDKNNFDNCTNHPGHQDQIIRLKYYVAYKKILSQFTEKMEMTSIFPPSETLSDDGFLQKEYAGDNVHGNEIYGRAVINQIKEYAKK